MSLVADYGSSDSDDSNKDLPDTKSDLDDDSDEEMSDQEINQRPEVLPTKLPSARGLLEGCDSIGVGVMKNPYKAAEDKKIATLEKHVKMVDTGAKVRVINGKKVCWAYRKGKCRFGSSCQYAHDSDLTTQAGNTEESSTSTMKTTNKSGKGIIKKKRPGLANSLIPGKKVLDMYSRLKNS